MENCASILIALVSAGVFVAGTSRAQDGPLIDDPRSYDEVYFKNGDVVKGTLTDTEDGRRKIKDIRKNTVRFFTADEAKEVRERLTPDQAVEKAFQRVAGDGHRTVKVAREAMLRFKNMTARAIAALEKESKSNDAELLAYLADIYLQSGQSKAALKIAETLVSVQPGKASSFMWRGVASAACGDNGQAEKDLNKAFEMDPNDTQILVARANLLLNSGRSTDAEKIFTNALDKDKRNVSALVGLGLVQLRQGKFSEAEQTFLQALQVNDKCRPAQIGLANAKLMNKQPEDAFKEADRILQSDTRCGEAYAVQALVKLFAGDKDSLAAFDRLAKMSLTEKPNQPRLMLAMAAALERQADLEAALNTPDSLASSRATRDQAEKKFQEIAELNPADSYLQYHIGERRFRGGDYQGALTAFQRAAELSPLYAPVHAAIGATALKLANWELAKDAYTKAQSIDASAAEYYAGQGLALLKMQRFKDAAGTFGEARKRDTQNVTALCGLGFVANAASDKNAAVEFFQQALAADGTCSYAADALKKIFVQDDQQLEYLTFTDNTAPSNWKPRSGGMVKPALVNGQVLFSGTQGSSMGAKVEFYRDLKAEDFVELQADFEIVPTSPVNFGLRIGSAAGSAIAFEIEFGKDESNELKVRYKDYRGPSGWTSVKETWPADGRVRLGIQSEDLKAGKVRFLINGKKSDPLTLTLQKPSRITAGFFVQAPPKETVRATVDNVALLIRGAPVDTQADDASVLFKKEEPKKEAPPPDDKKDVEKPK